MLKSKCKLTASKLSLCEGLQKSIQEQRRGGITEEIILNIRTGKNIRRLLVLRSGDFRKNGIVLNYCPFCGEQIYKEQQHP